MDHHHSNHQARKMGRVEMVFIIIINSIGHQRYNGDHHYISSNQENGEGGDGFHVTASEKALKQVLTYFGIWYIVGSYQQLS